MELLMIYLLAVNAAGFLIMLSDKRRAKKNSWRIPESALFLTAIIGGSFGCYIGMYTFRHKTKHLQFTVGIPAVMIAQCALGIYVLYRIL